MSENEFRQLFRNMSRCIRPFTEHKAVNLDEGTATSASELPGQCKRLKETLRPNEQSHRQSSIAVNETPSISTQQVGTVYHVQSLCSYAWCGRESFEPLLLCTLSARVMHTHGRFTAGQLFDCWSIVSIASEKLFELTAVSHILAVVVHAKPVCSLSFAFTH